MNNNVQNKFQSAQRGGALLVAMIMIFMLSIMGISAMRGSSLEKRMATNSVQTAITFQGAESTGEEALNDNENLQDAFEIADIAGINAGNEKALMPVPVDVDLKQDIGMDSSADLVYVGQGLAPGFGAGVGGANFVALRFESRGSAEVEAIRAPASVVQGAYRIAPGMN